MKPKTHFPSKALDKGFYMPPPLAQLLPPLEGEGGGGPLFEGGGLPLGLADKRNLIIYDGV